MTEVSKQVELEGIVPTDIKGTVRTFADGLYHGMNEEGRLPGVRNRHEAYGLIAEHMGALGRASKGVKGAIGSCEAMLSASDTSFAQIAGELYDEALGLVRDATMMSICAQNIIYELMANQPPLPMEDLIADAELIDGLDDISEDEEKEDEGDE